MKEQELRDELTRLAMVNKSLLDACRLVVDRAHQEPSCVPWSWVIDQVRQAIVVAEGR